MLLVILFLLFIFWLLGYGTVAILPFPVFSFMNRTITLWDLLIFLLIIWLIGILPGPFREIASIVFILWVLSVFGIIAVAGMANLLVIAIIVGLLIYVLSF
jgi:hypothetical protein